MALEMVVFFEDRYLCPYKILITLNIPLEPNILCTASYSNCALMMYFCVGVAEGFE